MLPLLIVALLAQAGCGRGGDRCREVRTNNRAGGRHHANGAILGAPVALANQCTGSALDSTIGAVTVTRSGSAYCPKSDGTFTTVAADKPRVIRMGLLVEGAATQLMTAGRDMTNGAWTKTNATAALTATGADGVANSASKMTATANNGTVTQTVTLSAGTNRAFGVSVRRRTGSGNVYVTFDNFGTSCDITAGLAAGMANGCQFIRVSQDNDTFRDETTEACTQQRLGAVADCAVLAQTGANPVVGIKLGTSGDAVDVDFAQLEVGNFSTTPVVNDGSRSADDVRVVTTSWPITQGSFEVRYSPFGMPSDFGTEIRYLVDTRETNTAGGDGIWLNLTGTNAKVGTITGGADFTQNSSFTTNDYITPYGKPRLWRMEWDTTSLRLKVNGVIRGTSNAPFLPTLHSGNRIGSRYDTAKFGQGVFSDIAVSSNSLDSISKGVVLLGDSILEGKYQVRVGDAMFLPMASHRRWVTSLAVSGARIDTIANSCGVLYGTYVQGFGFNTVAILCGINNILTGGDTGTEAEAKLETLLSSMISDGFYVVAMTLLPCNGYFTCSGTKQGYVIDFNALLRTFGAAHPSTMTVLDANAYFKDPNDANTLKPSCLVGGDGLHLNDACNLEFASLIEAAVP